MQVNDIMTMAKTFAESGLFADTKDLAKAFVKIQAGQEIGIAPFQAMSGIHIIQGKPTIGAGIMASKVKGSGKYDYKVLQQDETACILEFFEGKTSLGKSSFTIDDAKKAGTQNVTKYARNMLFARAISNGVKWYCPDVFSGPVYTPEDFNGVEQPTGNYTEDVEHEELLDIEKSLRDCVSLDELANVYGKLNYTDKATFKELKDALKLELTPFTKEEVESE